MPEDHAAPAGQAGECQSCPLCQAMAALRSARPAAVEHLLKAGAELLLAARALLEGEGEAAPQPGGGPVPWRRPARAGGRGTAPDNGLQHIDIG
jgi:hypothetical protein